MSPFSIKTISSYTRLLLLTTTISSVFTTNSVMMFQLLTDSIRFFNLARPTKAIEVRDGSFPGGIEPRTRGSKVKRIKY
jgi:hypothetical protein